MKVSALKGYQPQRHVNFNSKNNINRQSPCREITPQGAANLSLSALLLLAGIALAGCENKNTLTGLDKKAKTELAEGTDAAEFSVSNDAKIQTPVFNNHPVGQRLLDWYGANHLGIDIPQNKPITGYQYESSVSGQRRQFTLIQADTDNFKLIEKIFDINNPTNCAYQLHNYRIHGNNLIDDMFLFYPSGSNPYDPDTNWHTCITSEEIMQSDNSLRRVRFLTQNLLSTLAPQGPHQLRIIEPSGTVNYCNNVYFNVKKDGPVRPDYTIPMER